MASIQRRVSAATGIESWRVMYRIGGRQVSDSFTEPATARRYAHLVDTLGGGGGGPDRLGPRVRQAAMGMPHTAALSVSAETCV